MRTIGDICGGRGRLSDGVLNGRNGRGGRELDAAEKKGGKTKDARCDVARMTSSSQGRWGAAVRRVCEKMGCVGRRGGEKTHFSLKMPTFSQSSQKMRGSSQIATRRFCPYTVHTIPHRTRR